MSNRINIQELEPRSYRGMLALENYLQDSGLSPTHYYLIYIRASQLNGCAFCIDKHIADALGNGEKSQRIFLLSAWRETDFFTEEERVVLEMTEEITLIHQHGLSEETYARAKERFDEHYIAQIITAAATINAWNRIAISTKKMPLIQADAH